MDDYVFIWELNEPSQAVTANWDNLSEWSYGINLKEATNAAVFLPSADDTVLIYNGLAQITDDAGTVNSVAVTYYSYSAYDEDIGSLAIISGGSLNVTTSLTLQSDNRLSITSDSTGGGSSLTVATLSTSTDPVPDASGAGPIAITTAEGVVGSILRVTGTFDDGAAGVNVDTGSQDGGSTVTVTGGFTLGGATWDDIYGNGYAQADLMIGPSDGTLSADTTVTAGSFVFSPHVAPGAEGVWIYGGATAIAELDSLDAATSLAPKGQLDQYIQLSGHALFEVASGQVDELLAGGGISIDGPNAFFADAASSSTESALGGAFVIDASTDEFLSAGSLNFSDGANANFGSIANSGNFSVDNNADGWLYKGSKITIAGELSNAGGISIGGALYSTATTTIDVGGIDNEIGTTTGRLYIAGADNEGGKTIVDVGSRAGFGPTGTLVGDVVLTSNVVVEFGGGQISTIAKGATLILNGSEAFVADIGATSSNSALAGLTTNNGTLSLENADLATTGALNNSGSLTLYGYGSTPQSVQIGGALTNSGTISVGLNYGGEVGSTFSATGLDNAGAGKINLWGSATALGKLVVNGAATNAGAITLTGNTNLKIKGALTGAGSITLAGNGAALTLASPAAGGALDLTGDDNTIAMLTGNTVGETVSGFAVGDAVDFASIAYASGDYATLASNKVTVRNASGAAIASFKVGGALQAPQILVAEDAGGGVEVGYRPQVVVNANAKVAPAAGNKAIVTFSGNVPPTAGVSKVKIYAELQGVSGDEQLGAATLSPSGAWSFAATLANGTYNILTATATGSSPTSSTNASFKLIVDDNVVTQDNDDGSSIVTTVDITGQPYTETVALSAGGNGSKKTFGQTYAGALALAIGGSGTATLTGANSFTGGLTVDSGALAVASASELGNGAITLDDRTTLDFLASMTVADELKIAANTGIGTTTFDVAQGSSVVLSKDVIPANASETLAVTGGGVLALDPGTAYAGYWTINDNSKLKVTEGVKGLVQIEGGGTLQLMSGDALGGVVDGFTSSDDRIVFGAVAYASTDYATKFYDDAAGDYVMDIDNAAGQMAATFTTYQDLAMSSIELSAAGSGALVFASNGDDAFSNKFADAFTGGGESDILYETPSTGALTVWKVANGAFGGSISTGATLGTAGALDLLGAGDFTGNGTSDLLVENAATGALKIWTINDGVVQSKAGIGQALAAPWKVAAVGYFDGAAATDILWTNSANGKVKLWTVVDGAVTSQTSLGLSPGASWSVLGEGQFTDSGVSDVLWGNASTGALEYWEMDNGAVVKTVSLTAPGAGWTYVGSSDFGYTPTQQLLFDNASSGALEVETLTAAGAPNGFAAIGTTPTGFSVLQLGNFGAASNAGVLVENKATGALEIGLVVNDSIASWTTVGTLTPSNARVLA